MFAALHGNVFDAYTTELYEVDHARRLLGMLPIHLVMTAEAIRYVFRDKADTYPRHPAFLKMGQRIRGHGLLSSEGSSWLKQRRILSPAFARYRLAHQHPLANSVNDELCAAVRKRVRDGQSAIDVVPLARRWSIGQILKLVFTNDADAIFEDLLQITAGATTVLYGDTASIVGVPAAIPTPARFKGLRIRRNLDEIALQLLEKRQAPNSGQNDVFDRMLHKKDRISQTKLSRTETIDNIITFLLAGQDTTANSLAFTLYCVGLFKDVQDQVFREIETTLADKRHPDFEDFDRMVFTKAVIDEGLRFYPVIPLHVRMAATSEETPFGPVNKGDTICVPSWVTHFRSQAWDKPEEFRPERFLNSHTPGPGQLVYLPFAAGPHKCIGQVFARRILCFALVALVRAFRVNVPDRFSLKFKASPILHAAGGVSLSFTER